MVRFSPNFRNLFFILCRALGQMFILVGSIIKTFSTNHVCKVGQYSQQIKQPCFIIERGIFMQSGHVILPSGYLGHKEAWYTYTMWVNECVSTEGLIGS